MTKLCEGDGPSCFCSPAPAVPSYALYGIINKSNPAYFRYDR